MKKTLVKRLAAFLALCMMFPAAADATQEKIDRVQDEIQDLQQQKDEAQQKADSLSEEAGGLEGDLAAFNEKLTKITGSCMRRNSSLKARGRVWSRQNRR